MLHHLPDLLRYGVVEQVDPALPRVILPCFTVAKTDGSLRLVHDGRKLNDLMLPPPPMLLPPIHDVVSTLLSASFVIHTDARSWFYQFGLATEVRRFFGSRLAGPRGSFTTVQLCSMCMGWKWAPAVAHRAAMVLLPAADGAVWVDNFFVCGASAGDVAARYSAYLERTRLANAVMHLDAQGAGTPQQQFDALGLSATW
eukprot:TRINITY_DN6026_c0_g1_i3.p1 TRINITY_DN6026_c0_g1~~TRINITY_DN6026_c0_g1_i3.p1  ORF type:complete len:199 (+),score=7.61 TRINITY_DN6026_c0_g1_i3:1022-1618(+)